MTTLDRVLAFFHIDPTGLEIRARRMPIEIPNVGRADLAQLFCSLVFKRGAEIGVEVGLYAETLCKANPTGRLFCVDAWKPYRGYRDHVGAMKLEGFYAETRRRLAPYDVRFVREFSVEAARLIEDGSLDYVFIDANHDFQHVAEDLCAWIPKVRQGGIVSGHDWTRRSNPDDGVHVVETVTAYVQAMQIYPYFVLGAKDIKAGEVRDRPRSWFWVKQA